MRGTCASSNTWYTIRSSISLFVRQGTFFSGMLQFSNFGSLLQNQQAGLSTSCYNFSVVFGGYPYNSPEGAEF